jgi:hypothetical protein
MSCTTCLPKIKFYTHSKFASLAQQSGVGLPLASHQPSPQRKRKGARVTENLLRILLFVIYKANLGVPTDDI